MLIEGFCVVTKVNFEGQTYDLGLQRGSQIHQRLATVLGNPGSNLMDRRAIIETVVTRFIAPNKPLFPELYRRNLPRSYEPV